MDVIFDPSLVLYLPLHELDGSSFKSKDAYGHTCTVTGALWRPNGYYFDGSDDYIRCGNGGAFDLSSYATYEVWATPDTLSQNGIIVCNNRPAAGNGQIAFGIYNTTGEILLGTAVNMKGLSGIGTYLTANKAQHWVLIFDVSGDSFTFYLDGIASILDTVSTCFGSGDWSDLSLGRRSNGFPFAGMIHEVRVYRRALTAGEVQRNYLATKWRYQ